MVVFVVGFAIESSQAHDRKFVSKSCNANIKTEISIYNRPYDAGSKAHPFPYALVVGIERYPSKITRRMGTKKVEKRSKVKPFIKTVNYNHLMPTRYTLELEGLKGTVTNDTFKEVSQREEAKKTIKKALEERYTSGKNRWFFTPLSMFLESYGPHREQVY
ncbi:hypothetical protein TRV_03849 [Trichophyton verrucosum HKI 0517]|uniref:60S ribosomal protein L27 n=1 Tax=Trichophyton verrucosum (strain HKI 0517) TaxID=663202 RepID=D4D9Q6_TRIVH|nr:uncharacterized protein TRV_03849 [Trichophyton verrucosum HKI 0517]EFE41414.1 hypothetical protein TRV_03849 [Trichophyton verrucosum HKI 0517]